MAGTAKTWNGQHDARDSNATGVHDRFMDGTPW